MISLRLLKQSLACVFLLLAAFTAHAQLAVYAAPALTDYGYNYDYGNSSSFLYKSDSGGFIAGGFYNFPIQSRLTAGVDLRISHSFGSRGGTFVATAFRIGFEPHRNSLRPYFQLGAGVVSTLGGSALTFGTRTYTSGAAELAFGLDVKISEHFDIRAVEYGATAGGSAGTGFLDAGIIYRWHPRTP